MVKAQVWQMKPGYDGQSWRVYYVRPDGTGLFMNCASESPLRLLDMDADWWRREYDYCTTKAGYSMEHIGEVELPD